MEENEETEEERLERLEDEEFARTGVFTTSFSFNVKITERDMLTDLVERTEGESVDPDTIYKPSEN